MTRDDLVKGRYGVQYPRAYGLVADWGVHHLGQPFRVATDGAEPRTMVLAGSRALGADEVEVTFDLDGDRRHYSGVPAFEGDALVLRAGGLDRCTAITFTTPSQPPTR